MRKIAMPINHWIPVARQMSMLAKDRKQEGVARMVAGKTGLDMLQEARVAERTHKDLLAAIDQRFEELGRSELAAQQQMAREELIELGEPNETEKTGHAQLREDTEKLLADTTTKIQEIGRRTLEFQVPAWMAEDLALQS